MGVCYTSSHFHIFIFTSTQIILKSSHLHIFIFTSTQIILKSSHFHILTSAHLHTSSHIFSYLLSSSHLHIVTSSHLHIFSLSLSCPLALCHGLSPSFTFLSLAVPTRRNEVQSSKTEVKLRIWRFRGNHFARNEVRSSKAEGFLRLWLVRRQPFRTK